MKMNNSIIHLGPALEEASTAIILIHGRGSSAEDIARLAEFIPGESIAWLAPSAPEGSWYPRRFLAPLNENEPHLGEALATVDQLISRVLAAGLPSRRMGLAGFSQGACLALEYVLRRPRRYAFGAGYSGAVIGPLDTERPPADLEGTPILLACAEHDGHIPFEFVEHSERILTRSLATVTLQTYPGSTHTIFPQGIEWLIRIVQDL